jgi:hypothetical protein
MELSSGRDARKDGGHDLVIIRRSAHTEGIASRTNRDGTVIDSITARTDRRSARVNSIVARTNRLSARTESIAARTNGGSARAGSVAVHLARELNCMDDEVSWCLHESRMLHVSFASI